MRRPTGIHAKHLLLLGLAFACSIPYGLGAAASLLAGGGIQVLHLLALERGVRRLLDPTVVASRVVGLALNLARFALLLGVVLWVLTSTPVEPIPFGIGLMVVVPAAAWYGLAARVEDS